VALLVESGAEEDIAVTTADDRNSIQQGVDEAAEAGHDSTDSTHSTR
jgi:hypothetical protein